MIYEGNAPVINVN